eukprot:3195895-Prymnesium_polylepis.1
MLQATRPRGPHTGHTPPRSGSSHVTAACKKLFVECHFDGSNALLSCSGLFFGAKLGREVPMVTLCLVRKYGVVLRGGRAPVLYVAIYI